ncbi:protein-ADP-ribose hydrolase [Cohnella suwonensis]|uniref:Protein-ADP-ribose hydrolase n=1 Tax=Cohnella suwonensis TaxID=696072 RepID=A0ABW0LYK0_9BACL
MQGSIQGLPLERYRKQIDLDILFDSSYKGIITEEAYVSSIYVVLSSLLTEREGEKPPTIPAPLAEKRSLIKALLTMRAPRPFASGVQSHLDILLAYDKGKKGFVASRDLPTVQEQFGTSLFPSQFVMWQGDITMLDADAIVNAANNQMLGCFQPFHRCIDNAIHAAAGPRLREDCEVIMSLQGYLEPTGTAKITRAYHLPSRYVLHTVGPIIPSGQVVTEEQRKQLASCYSSCLSVAAEVDDIRTIAFCGISTGVFGYPKQEAAQVAVEAVTDWLNENPGSFDRIIFNVYGEEDLDAYKRIFER